MVRVESDCVGCTPDLPCIGGGCLYYGDRPHYYCDECGSEADYEVDGEHYCKDCLEFMIEEEFSDLSLEEKLDMLDHSVINLFA